MIYGAYIPKRRDKDCEFNATTRKVQSLQKELYLDLFTQGYESGFTATHHSAHLQKIPFRFEGSSCASCHSACPLLPSIALHLAVDRPRLRQCSTPARLQRLRCFLTLKASPLNPQACQANAKTSLTYGLVGLGCTIWPLRAILFLLVYPRRLMLRCCCLSLIPCLHFEKLKFI